MDVLALVETDTEENTDENAEDAVDVEERTEEAVEESFPLLSLAVSDMLDDVARLDWNRDCTAFHFDGDG